MAASFTSTPPKWALTQDPIWVRVSSDNVDTTPGTGNFILAFGDDLTAGQVLTIAWGTTSLVLTVAASPTGQLEIPTTTSSEGSVRNLIDYLYRQPAIAKAFSLQYQPIGDHRILASYRTTDVVDISVTLVGGTGGPTITVTDKTDVYLESNLTAYLQVMEQDTQDSSAYLREYVGAYDPATAVAAFNIKEAFNLKPHVPPYYTGSFIHDQAEDCFAKYRVQCADRYGATPSPERMTAVSDRLAIYGGVPLDSAFALNDGSDTLQILHHYQSYLTGASFAKPIAHNGADYIYFVVVDDVSMSFKVKAYYQDGTSAIFNLHVGTLDFYTDEVSYLASGPSQLDLEGTVTDWDDVVKYDIQIYLEDGSSTLKASVAYEVDWKVRPWQLDLLYSNGCGGMEVLRALGKSEYSTAVAKETAEAQATYQDNAQDGRLFTFAQEGSDRINVEIGWNKQDYLYHLAQIIYSDVWLLDDGEWVRYSVVSDSITMRKDDNVINSFKFQIEKAFTQSNHVK